MINIKLIGMQSQLEHHVPIDREQMRGACATKAMLQRPHQAQSARDNSIISAADSDSTSCCSIEAV